MMRLAQSDERSGAVLLVDDEAALRHVRSRGSFETKTTRSPKHRPAKKRSRRSTSTPFDVIVCDIGMPEMPDGMTLLRLVRERDPDLPVVLLTGSPDVATAVKAVGYGAFEYLTMPDDLHRLKESVARAISQRHDSTIRRRLVESAQAKERRTPTGPIATGALVADRYRVGRLLGYGGMGTVYEARREDLAGMPVALKVLHERHVARADHVQRFRREAEVVARINHPNIVKVIDFVASDGEPPCFVMELLEGETLAAAIAHDLPFSEQRVAFVAVQVLGRRSAQRTPSTSLHRDLKLRKYFSHEHLGRERRREAPRLRRRQARSIRRRAEAHRDGHHPRNVWPALHGSRIRAHGEGVGISRATSTRSVA